MKTILPVVALLFLFLQSCNSGPSMTPIEYNDKIINEQSKIIKLTMDLIENFDKDINKCEEIRIQTIAQCDSSIAVINKMEPYEGNSELKSAGLGLISFYKSIYSNEYKEMLDILKKGEEITPEDITRITDLNTEITAKETVVDQTFKTAQENFSKKYNFGVKENDLQKQIDGIK